VITLLGSRDGDGLAAGCGIGLTAKRTAGCETEPGVCDHSCVQMSVTSSVKWWETAHSAGLACPTSFNDFYAEDDGIEGYTDYGGYHV